MVGENGLLKQFTKLLVEKALEAEMAEQYGTEVSPEFISSVTDAVMDEVTAWQSRPLEPMYPVVFFDALRVKIRKTGFADDDGALIGRQATPRTCPPLHRGHLREKVCLAATRRCAFS